MAVRRRVSLESLAPASLKTIASLAAFAAMSIGEPRVAFAQYGEWSLDVRTHWMPRLPKVGISAPSSDSDYDAAVGRVPDGSAPLGNGGVFLGGAFSYDWIIRDRLKIPLFGIAGGGMVGSQPRVVSAIDGSLVTAHPAHSGFVTLLLPGLGFRRNVRRWSFGAEARFGVTILFAPMDVAQGSETSSFTSRSTTLALFGELSACRRLDPLQRVCLFVAPSIYEYGWWNGGSLGLRWEVAP